MILIKTQFKFAKPFIMKGNVSENSTKNFLLQILDILFKQPHKNLISI
jgi:hypothetical protein